MGVPKFMLAATQREPGGASPTGRETTARSPEVMVGTVAEAAEEGSAPEDSRPY